MTPEVRQHFQERLVEVQNARDDWKRVGKVICERTGTKIEDLERIINKLQVLLSL